MPHAKWENRERRRALFLFDCTQRRRLLNDSLLDDAGLPSPPTRWQCEVDSNEIARFGDAADGYARASEAHKLPHEVRVDLSAVAINAIADSVIVDGSELPRGASLYEYLAHAGAGQRGELRHQALWRYFGACASRRVLPLEAMPLLEHILAAKDRQTLDAYIQACARSGHTNNAHWPLHDTRIQYRTANVSTLHSAMGMGATSGLSCIMYVMTHLPNRRGDRLCVQGARPNEARQSRGQGRT